MRTRSNYAEQLLLLFGAAMLVALFVTVRGILRHLHVLHAGGLAGLLTALAIVALVRAMRK